MTQQQVSQDSPYALGHAERELERLIAQARYFGDLTAHVLQLAGLTEGMRVLDVGSGAGDVAFLAASIVGAEGMVIGVDKGSEAVALATQRATAAGLTNVQFLNQDVTNLTLEQPVDAVIGRLVLLYQPDPAAVLRHLATCVKPGGLIVFHEFDLASTRSVPPCPIFDTTVQQLVQGFARIGIDSQIGLRLSQIFQEAGLPAPQMILEARVEHGPESQAFAQLTGITRTLLPVIERTGVATAEEVAIETLADRMREEAVRLNATLIAPLFIGAWTRKA